MDSEERHKWSRGEREILQTLDSILKEKFVKDTVELVAAKLRSRVAEQHDCLMAKEPLPIATYGDKLPGVVRSSWVYLMNAPAVAGPERHPNSHQRTMAYTGTGFFEVNQSPDFDGEDEGASFLLVGAVEGPLETRWVSIPEDLWHQAVVPEGEWVLVSFHTAPEKELVEERPG